MKCKKCGGAISLYKSNESILGWSCSVCGWLQELTTLIYFKVTTKVGLWILNEADGDEPVRTNQNHDSAGLLCVLFFVRCHFLKKSNTSDMHRRQFSFCLPSSSSSSPILDISGTDAWYGPSRNFGSLSLISWIFTMNSDSGSSGRSVRRLRAWARRAYWAFTSRSSLWMAWMSPVLSSMVKVVPAPSPVRMYLMEPSPLSMSEWSWGLFTERFLLHKGRKDPFGTKSN